MKSVKFIYNMNLPHRAKSVYIYLNDRTNKDRNCFPSIRTISKELGMSRSSVIRAIADLKKAGLVKTEQRFRANGGKSSLLFTLL